MSWAVAIAMGVGVAFAAWFVASFTQATPPYGCDTRVRHRLSIRAPVVFKAPNDFSEDKAFVLSLVGNADSLRMFTQRDEAA